MIECLAVDQRAKAEEERKKANPLLSCLGRQGMLPGFEETWRAVLRPPRDMYTHTDLGPPQFVCGGRSCMRQDVELVNMNGTVLQGSHYLPTRDADARGPCVVFCHGNSSSRLEAYDCVQVCLPLDISVFCFDFSGCGMSEGQYVTLGYQEQKDLKGVLQYIRQTGRATAVSLWGRSMGASTSIFIAAEDLDLTAVVLDSPFTSLRTIALELGNEAVPRFMLNMGLDLLRDEVLSRTGANLDALVPIEAAPLARCPAIFAASVEDDFIKSHHAKQLQQAWGGVSDIYYFNGPHNGNRPQWFLKEAASWLAKQFESTGASRPAAQAGYLRSSHAPEASSKSREAIPKARAWG